MLSSLNFIGILVIVMILFILYDASEKGPFIFKNSKTHKILIDRMGFIPKQKTINLGDEITWQSTDHVLRHTVVNDDPFLRNSEVLLRGDEFKIIFDRPGEYKFYSSLYDEFKPGLVIVKEVRKGSEFRGKLKDNVVNVVLNLIRVFLQFFKKFANSIINTLQHYSTKLTGSLYPSMNVFKDKVRKTFGNKI